MRAQAHASLTFTISLGKQRILNCCRTAFATPATTAESIGSEKINVPRWIRTTDLQLRRLLLYPAELSGPARISITELDDSFPPNSAG